MIKRLPPLPRWMHMSGWVALFVFSFSVFFYWSFPYDRLRDYLMQRLMRAEREGDPSLQGLHVEVGELEPYWLTGVKLANVRVQKLNRARTDTKLDMSFDALTVRLSILPLLFGNKKIKFDASLGAGSLDGSISQSDESLSVQLEAEELPLQQMLRQGLEGLPLFGTLNGEVDLDLSTKPDETEGQINLSIKDFAMGDGKSEVQLLGSGFAIDHAKAGDLSLVLDVVKGMATIKQFASKGRDLELAGTGTLRLAYPFDNSSIDALMRVKVNKVYREKYTWVNSIMALAKFNPAQKDMITPDEAFQFRLQGLFSARLRSTPAGRERLPL